MYKLVIWDMDGTVLDSDLVIVLTWTALFNEFAPDKKPSINKLLSFSGPSLVESLSKEFPDIPLETTRNAYLKYSYDYYWRYGVAYPYVREVIEECKKRGVKVAVNTNKHRVHAEMALEILDMVNLFDSMVSGGDVANYKPHPEGVYKIMEETGITNKEEILYVGDGVFDYQTAENAGVDCMISTIPPHQLPKVGEGFNPKYFIKDFKDFFEILEGNI